MVNKRGISQVITTVILVVLVLVAIGIVWGVVGNLISESSDDVSINGFTVGLGLEKVLLEENSIIIDVERKKGKGEIVGIGFILNDGTDSEIIEEATNLQELEIGKFVLTPEELSLSSIKDISIYPIYSSKYQGKKGNVVDDINVENLEIQDCVQECGGLECGLDPICGESCGSCGDDICSEGVCQEGIIDALAWWNFDGDVSDLIGENDGIIEGDVTLGTGKFNQAYSFSGEDDSFINVLDSSSFDILDPVTISFWIKPNDIEKDQRVFYRKGWVEVKIKDEELEFKWKNKNSGDLKPEFDLIEEDVNVWMHVVSIVSENEAKLYINSELKDTNSDNNFELKEKNKDLYFGSKEGTNKEYIGFIDEIIIFDRVLTEEEIDSLYQTNLF